MAHYLTTIISGDDTIALQYKLLQRHSVGVGSPVQAEIAKLMLLLCKAHSLAMGFSGMQLVTIRRILWHFENDIIPGVPEKDSGLRAI